MAEFMFPNVVYRATVYRTGALPWKIEIANWSRMRFLWLSKIKWTIQTRLHEVMKYETEKYVIFGVFSNSLKSPAICKAQCNFPYNYFLLGFLAPFYSFFKLHNCKNAKLFPRKYFCINLIYFSRLVWIVHEKLNFFLSNLIFCHMKWSTKTFIQKRTEKCNQQSDIIFSRIVKVI